VIVPGQRTPIVIATRPVDFRRGHAALAATVQNELGLDPHSGLTVVFRSKRMDRVKILVWDGSGLVLIYKGTSKNAAAWAVLGQGEHRMTAERRVGGDRRRFSVVFARSVAVHTHVFRHRLAHVGPRAAARPSSCTARRML